MEKILAVNITIIVVVPCIILARKLFLYYFSGRIWLFLWKFFIFQLLASFVCSIKIKNTCVTESAEPFLQFQDKIYYFCDSIFTSRFGNALKIIWVLCGLIIAIFFISTHWMNIRIYRTALPVEGEYFENWKIAHPLKRKIKICKSDRILIPLTYGIIEPVIVLPSHGKITCQNIEVALEHEFMHIKNFDVLLKWIIVFICSFYWYNPVIWIMYVYVNRDIEISCDEATLKQYSPEYKKTYLLTLIDFEERIVNSDCFCSFLCKFPTEERIKVITLKNKKSIYQNTILALLITVISFAFIMNAGIIARANTTVFSRKDVLKGIPNIVEKNEIEAQQTLKKYGLSFIKN